MHLVEALAAQLGLSEALAVHALVAARLAPLVLLAPFVGLRGAPPVLRAGVLLALTVSFGSLARGTAMPPSTPLSFVLALARETAVGAVFSLVASLPLFALDATGRLVDTYRGASLAEVLAPPTGERTSPLGDLLLMFGGALFLAMGGHRVAFGALGDSLTSLPVGSPLPGDVGAATDAVVRAIADALAIAAAFAAPAAAAALLVDLALGVMSRAVPAVPTFFAAMPLRAAVGIAALLGSLSLVTAELPALSRGAVDLAARIVRALGAP